MDLEAGEAYWGDQHLEEAGKPAYKPKEEEVLARIKEIQKLPEVAAQLAKAAEYFQKLLRADTDFISQLRNYNKFIIIASPPRSGGTYCKKVLDQLNRSDHERTIPSYVGHDGFPVFRTDFFEFDQFYAGIWSNKVHSQIMTWAEFLVMNEFYYGPLGSKDQPEHVWVIKNIHLYRDFNFLDSLLGPAAHYIINLRPTIEVYYSILEKANLAGQEFSIDARESINIIRMIAIINRRFYNLNGWNVTHESFPLLLLNYLSYFHMRLAVDGIFGTTYQVANYGPRLKDFCANILQDYGVSQPVLEEFHYKKYDFSFSALSPRLLPAAVRRKYHKFDTNLQELYATGLQHFFGERMLK